MVELESIKIVLQGLSTLASLIKLRRETLKEDREPSPSEMEQALELHEVTTKGFETLAAAISEGTLNAINDVIDRARKRYEDAIRDPANNKQARDAEEQIAKSTICGELKRIKRHNGGDLPEEYEDDWIEFECA